ncbi:MAG TPA: hypothetical protein VM533_11875 [Fimbriiglobus sp.]|jgi:hypothetical protein|nr:hypothetical protein [Fimbriiglobus sp.]
MVMKTRRSELWVVYRMSVKGSADGANAVCTQAEWDVLELARPGHHALLRAGIGSEAEAERLARGTSGDTIPRGAPRPSAGPAVVAAQ